MSNVFLHRSSTCCLGTSHPLTWQLQQKGTLLQTPVSSGGDRLKMNCPSLCGRGGEAVRSGGPWPAVSWGMRVVVRDRGGTGRGSGDSVVMRTGCLSGRMKVNRVVLTHEAPLALARNLPVRMMASLLARSSQLIPPI